MIILETERLLLRRYTKDDAPFFHRLANDPSWLQYIGDRKIYSLQDAEQYLLNGPIQSYTDNGYGFALVVLKDGGFPIGSCGLGRRPFLEHADIGFAFMPEYTRQGYGFEIASATLKYAQEVLHLNPIVAIVTKDNMRSIRLLNKIGLQFEKMILLDGEEICQFSTDAPSAET